MARFSSNLLAAGFQHAAAVAKPPRMDAPSPLMASALVAIGGGTGAVLRYQLARAMANWLGQPLAASFPWATLTANVAGSIAMGLLAGILARDGASGNYADTEHWRLLLGVGLLGGFTTFSSFSLEMLQLIERGQATQAMAYALASVLAGLAGLWLGLVAMRIA